MGHLFTYAVGRRTIQLICSINLLISGLLVNVYNLLIDLFSQRPYKLKLNVNRSAVLVGILLLLGRVVPNPGSPRGSANLSYLNFLTHDLSLTLLSMTFC